VKGDAVDEALGEYINTMEDKSKLKVMFIRVNPGVYQFGSKKICIKVEQGKINIRVGGGFMIVDEFIDTYTTVELEKSLRDGIDPMGGLSSPMKCPGLGGGPPKKRLTAPDRSVSPKKLLHRVNVSPVPGSNQR
jgi:hypothetical protein